MPAFEISMDLQQHMFIITVSLVAAETTPHLARYYSTVHAGGTAAIPAWSGASEPRENFPTLHRTGPGQKKRTGTFFFLVESGPSHIHRLLPY